MPTHVLATTNGRTASHLFTYICGIAVSVMVIIGGLPHSVWWVALGGGMVAILAYSFVCEIVNRREIVVIDGQLTGRNTPIPTFEKYDEIPIENVRYCAVTSKPFSSSYGGGQNYYVGVSVRGRGKSLVRLIVAKGKEDAELLAKIVNDKLRELQPNKSVEPTLDRSFPSLPLRSVAVKCGSPRR